jgi:predicted NBD/HSP70 family sugar kinase
MEFRGFDVPVKNLPGLDKGFVPFAAVKRLVDEKGRGEIGISLESGAGKCSVHRLKIMGGKENEEFDRFYAERAVKFLLWMKGANKVGIYGNPDIARHIKKKYAPGGTRAFDAAFMAGVFEDDFTVHEGNMKELPGCAETGIAVGGNLNGCRIGFDAGGSDLKVSAVQDGKVLYANEVVWHPKLQDDPQYHYDHILSVMKEAAAHLPRVDAIGVSSAGIYVDNKCMVASLFIKVPKEKFAREVKDIYIRVAGEIGAPLVVLNDGDVAALAGAMGMGENSVLGIAMGTSEAAGFVDGSGNIRGWLNELAFAPVDLQDGAMEDEWSGDIGCGAKYFSQDGVIKLAGTAGIGLLESDPPARKLVSIQALMEEGDVKARAVYESMGVYLGHTAALYHDFYGMKNILLMGRTVSGKGGDLILSEAKRVLAGDYPDLKINVTLPDEKMRRVGQAVTAASLPKL